jgi:hypothetical protein
MENQKYCAYLKRVCYVVYEISGGIQPAIMPEQWKYMFDEAYTGMEWNRCIETPYGGPCWQYKYEFSKDEWQKCTDKRKIANPEKMGHSLWKN